MFLVTISRKILRFHIEVNIKMNRDILSTTQINVYLFT